jgi:hypothetical protein
MRRFKFLQSGLLWALLLAVTAVTIPACDSDKMDDESFYTFTGEMMGQYFKARPDGYSEFTRMLDTTGVMGLLNAYGEYTCFSPDDEAWRAYYKKKGKASLSGFPLDTIKKMVYDHIIKGYVIPSDAFVDGFLYNLTMSGRYVRISYGTSTDGLPLILVNTTSSISRRDIEVHNGVIHSIREVLQPTENSVVEAIAEKPEFSLFMEALIATGLNEKLTPVKDESYVLDPVLADLEGTKNGIGSIIHVPKERKYGFTVLMESNATLAANGITNLDEMKAYAKTVYDKVYPKDAGITDITNRKNSLNRFIAYHLMDKKLPAVMFIEKYDNTGSTYASTGATHAVKTYDMFEYIETMNPNTLLEVRTLRETNEYNLFNMIPETGAAVRIKADNFDNDALNGVFHEIDNILVYSTEVERMLSSKKLRMDAAAFFPELTNNNMRVGSASALYPSERWYFPKGYIDRVTTSETTEFGYFNSDDRFLDYQGDEVFLSGMYDFSIETLPIPAGTYEIRFGYQPTGNRGAAQLYWDGQPCGIPLDLRLTATNAKIGYVAPGTDAADPFGYENDKMMRNRGYMKGPASFKVIKTQAQGGWYSGASARMSPSALRRILGIYTFKEAGTHIFSVKAARAGEFMFDYLEFVPVEVLEYEGID